jgi:hypothetical protein
MIAGLIVAELQRCRERCNGRPIRAFELRERLLGPAPVGAFLRM